MPAIAIFAALLLAAASSTALAQSYPGKPVRWLIPFVPGGALDLLTRGYAPELAKALGQPVVPDNRPANNGVAAQEALAKSPPDGYTLLTSGTAALTYNKIIYSGIQYEWERDFTPVTSLAKAPVALWISASIPPVTLKDFIAYAKEQPGRVNYGAAGHGHPFHLGMELFKSRTGTDMLFVPYKGMTPVLQDMLAGRVHAMIYPPTENVISLVKSGKLRALAVAADQRLAALPDVPTFTEAGMADYDPSGAMGLFAPGGTPREIVNRLNAEIVRLSKTPELVRVYQAEGLGVLVSTPDGLAEQMRRERDTWVPLVRKLGIRAE
jgi:tripartite-type tricarboxylate transporter receptor subunit TctC